jgi:hypothetical protein
MTQSIAILVLIGVCFTIAFMLPSLDEKEINGRMSENGITVQTVKARFFNWGPYFYFNNTRIYEVNTDKGTFWVRFGTWSGPDIHKEIEGGYEEQKW